jgi:hypothetical protein
VTPFEKARAELRNIRVILQNGAGEYRLRHKFGGEEQSADDLEDAVMIGRDISANPPPEPEKNPGPLGSPEIAKRKSKRFRHNRGRLARIEKQKRAKIKAEITAKVRKTKQ